jgi:hypothetical protein
MIIARVFPRRTKFTPDDELAFVGNPPIDPPIVDEVHISITFTWDILKAKELAILWERIAPVKIGGPALGTPSNGFTPGMFLKNGVVITSRGCKNKCWFCYVWKRQKELIELPIHDGYIIQDDNLLACSKEHIIKVFDMLRRQKRGAIFSGGLEAKVLEEWHVDLFNSIKIKQIFFAYDAEDDWEPLVKARAMMKGYDRHKLMCYVLIGYPKDTMEKAEERLQRVKDLDIQPFAMLYRDDKGDCNSAWRAFQKKWCRPAIIYTKNKKEDEKP